MRITNSIMMNALGLRNGARIKINGEVYTVNDCILSGKGNLNGKHLLTLDGMDFDVVKDTTCRDISCDRCPLKYFDCQEVLCYSNTVDESDSLKDIASALIKDDPELLKFVLERLKG